MVDDRYSQVSSLYGPGITVCWFLTVLSCFVSWTVHTKKRISGSIDSDFIALLTYPVVASGHLICQVKNYPGIKAEIATTEDSAMLKLVAAIEASLNITETFLAISVTLLLIAVCSKCVKRAISLAVTGLFCFSAESYLFLSCSNLRTKTGNFSRSFLVNFLGIWIVLLVLVIILIAATFSLVAIFYVKRPQAVRTITIGPRTDSEANAAAHLAQAERDLLQGTEALWLTMMSIVLLPLTFFGTIAPVSFDLVILLSNSSPIRALINRLVCDLLPRTDVSVKELDQAVAIFAGTTVLGFGIYGAANSRFKHWQERMAAAVHE